MGLVAVAHSHLLAALLLVPLSILLPHLFADLFEIAQGFLVVGLQSQRFLDFFESLAEVILDGRWVTMLARAQPLAM